MTKENKTKTNRTIGSTCMTGTVNEVPLEYIERKSMRTERFFLLLVLLIPTVSAFYSATKAQNEFLAVFLVIAGLLFVPINIHIIERVIE